MEAKVIVTDEVMKVIKDRKGSLTMEQFARRTGVPIMTVRRILRRHRPEESIRIRAAYLSRMTGIDYQPYRVEAKTFSRLAKLWGFIYSKNQIETARYFSVDERTINGRVNTVEYRAHREIIEFFENQGVSLQEAIEWTWLTGEERLIPFATVEPLLKKLQRHLQVGYRCFLKQNISRYKSGPLNRVSGSVYRRLKRIDRETQRLEGQNLEFYRARLTGRKARYLYEYLKPMLAALEKRTGNKPRHYLGRHQKPYEEGRLKTVNASTANKIISEFKIQVAPLLVLVNILEQILELKQKQTGCVKMELAYLLTDMNKNEFDRYVAEHTAEIRSQVSHCGRGFEIEVNYLKKLRSN